MGMVPCVKRDGVPVAIYKVSFLMDEEMGVPQITFGSSSSFDFFYI